MEALARALEDGGDKCVDSAVHALLLLLGDPQSTTQRRRLATLELAMAKLHELVEMQRHVALVSALSVPSTECELQPLSYSQLQMFTLQTMAPESTAYNIVRAVKMLPSSSLPLDLEALQRTCDALLAKHEVLRTLVAVDTSGIPRQRVMPLHHFHDRQQPLLHELQYATCDSEETKELGAFIAAHTTKPFDLTQDAPIRFYAITTPQEQPQQQPEPAEAAPWVLVVVIHHIATDPESSGVFWSDFAAFYSHFHKTKPSNQEFENEIHQLEAQSSLCVSYRDYAQWQRRRLASGMLAASLQYWVDQLSQREIPQLELPYDHHAPPATSSKGDRAGRTVIFQTTPELQQRFSTLCGSHGTGLFIGLLAVFHMLLGRLSNCEDIVIGAPTSGRSSSHDDSLDGLMGYFVNTLPFRLQAKPESTFSDFLVYVKDVVVQGLSHMEIPLQKMLEHVQLDRKGASSSFGSGGVFQVMFAWENDTEGASGGDQSLHTGMAMEDIPLPHQTAKFDLMLSMRTTRNAHGEKVIEGTLEYPVDTFEHATVERFATYFVELVTQVTQDPHHKKLSEIQMIPPLERSQLLRDWGSPPVVTDASTAEEQAQFVDECIRNQTLRTPHHVALRFEGHQWTYQQLYTVSRQLSEALTPGSGQTSMRVGLFLDRGLENIASILAVLQARAVFIPLDPEFPQDRIQYMLHDSRAEVVITQRHLAEKLQQLLLHDASIRVVIYDDVVVPATDDVLLPQPPSSSTILLPCMDPAETIAYILYTSGSTGNPKGVMVTHANLLTTLTWSLREYQVTCDDLFLQSTSSTLDGSLTQLFTPLLAGASVLITKKNGLHDLSYIANLLTTYRVTFCVFVPSYFSMLMDFMGAGAFPSSTVKYVVLAGETFPTALATRFYEQQARYCEISQSKVCGTCLVNEYGPTEASVTSTFYRFPYEQALVETSNNSGSNRQQQSVPIGKAIDDHFLVVLDKHKRLVPANVAGELYVGGRGVAKGYWNRPEMTQKSFDHGELTWLSSSGELRAYGLTDEQPKQEQQIRWYKTGDLVKWLPSGDLLFVGRSDSQVKLRGMRIELQEVRNVLLQSPQVKDAEVLVVHERLVAFVILTTTKSTRSPSTAATSELREYAGRRLPVHMVPHEIVVVDEWPRTPNGKLDLKALALYKAPVGTTQPPGETTCSSTGTSNQDDGASAGGSPVVVNILKQAWREVLDLEDDAMLCHGSFFELGGNSLSAIRVISLVKPHGVCLKLESFFRCKNLLEMAVGCAASLQADVRQGQGKSPGGGGAIVPLNWKPWNNQVKSLPLFLIHCADGTVWKMMELARRLPFAVFGVQATLGRDATGVDALAKLYWHEIKAVQRCGPYRIGGFSFGCRVAYAIARLGQQEGATFQPLTLLDGRPFCFQSSDKQGDKDEGEDEEQQPQAGLDDDDNVVSAQYVARALGWKPSQQQQPPHDRSATASQQLKRDPEQDLFDQLVANYSTHCALDKLYRPCTIGQEATNKVRVNLFKTSPWDVDKDAYHQFGIAMEIIDVPGEHLTMLRPPHVERLAQALLHACDK